MIGLKVIIWYLLENTICRFFGHSYFVSKTIKSKDPNSQFEGVLVLECKYCKKTKMAWYGERQNNID